MNRKFKTALIAIPLSLYLTGCVIAVNEDGTRTDWIGSSTESWKQKQKENKSLIADLEMGDSYEDVRKNMGTPDINEAFSDGDKKYQVLFYRTQHRHSDGETTKDECTPLIFVDGKLISWGNKAYRNL